MSRPKIVIAGACRTPVGRFGGQLKSVSAQELLRVCFKETLRRTQIDPEIIDGAIAGTCTHLPDSMNIARVALLLAGLSEEEAAQHREKRILPHSVVASSRTVAKGAFTVSRNCGSGAQAVISAAQAIYAGDAGILLVGGTESMSHAPYMLSRDSAGYHIKDASLIDSLLHGLIDPLTGDIMGLTAEYVAEKYGITRNEQDLFAVSSHQKAFRAIRQGKFKPQLASVSIREPGFMGVRESVANEDEGPNPALTAEKLAPHKSYFKTGGTVTPANSCSVNDGAASFLVLTEDRARALGITPQAEIAGYGVAALDPSYMGEGPICAIPKMLSRAGMSIGEIDLFEINEAFAATTIAVQRVLEIPDEKLNLYGGAIALGHPVGATGAILTVKAIYALKDFNKEHAIVSLCVGNGQGVALFLRNIA